MVLQQQSVNERAPLLDHSDSRIRDVSSRASFRRRWRKFVRYQLPIVAAVALVLSMVLGIIVVFRTSFKASDFRNRKAEESIHALNHGKTKKKNVQAGCESTVLLMRHCEKKGPRVRDNTMGNDHCSYLGLERAEHLATLFGRNGTARWPSPDHLYALNSARPESKHAKFRQVETLRPLSEQASIEIDTRFTVGTELALAEDIFQSLRSGHLCGRVVVITWKYDKMGSMAVALGCGPLQGCPTQWKDESAFDDVWEVKYVYAPPVLYDQEVERDAVDTTHKKSKRKWSIFGGTTEVGFDPLSFSNKVGDYPSNGATTGGRWNIH